MDLGSPLHLGRLALANRAFLAPLAGVSDPPFRRICQEHGAGLTFVEMLSATALIHAGDRTRHMMTRHASEQVLGVQVTGAKPDEVGQAVAILDAAGYDAIDINMGCPVRKIVAAGWGSAFLREPDRLKATVEAARAATNKPLSVKIRLGFHPESVNVEDNARLIASAGADMLTIHGRTRADSYGVRVNYDGVARGFRAAAEVARPGLVKVGNGDIMDRASGHAMVASTACDAVLVSRGALGNPWIFGQLIDAAAPEPTIEEWRDVVLRHIDYHGEFHGTDVFSAHRLRKHLLWYAGGFPRCNRLRRILNGVETLDVARRLIREYAAEFPSDLRRYEEMDVLSDRAPANDPKYQMDRVLDRGVGDDGLPTVPASA